MKVTIYSASGSAINPEHKNTIRDLMNAKMDELEKEKGKITYDNAKSFQEILVPYHNELMEKYPISEEIDLPTSYEEYEALCEKYDTAVAFCMEEHGLVAYVLDSSPLS